jgi:hypothetical protein
METKSVRICSLPREARLVFTVYGLEVIDTKENKRRTFKKEIGWCSLQLYNFERFLAQGTFLLPLWPPEVEKQVGPAPDSGSHPAANTCPVLSIELPELVSPVVFPDKIPIQPASRMDFNFNGRRMGIAFWRYLTFAFCQIWTSRLNRICWTRAISTC